MSFSTVRCIHRRADAFVRRCDFADHVNAEKPPEAVMLAVQDDQVCVSWQPISAFVGCSRRVHSPGETAGT